MLSQYALLSLVAVAYAHNFPILKRADEPQCSLDCEDKYPWQDWMPECAEQSDGDEVKVANCFCDAFTGSNPLTQCIKQSCDSDTYDAMKEEVADYCKNLIEDVKNGDDPFASQTILADSTATSSIPVFITKDPEATGTASTTVTTAQPAATTDAQDEGQNDDDKEEGDSEEGAALSLSAPLALAIAGLFFGLMV